MKGATSPVATAKYELYALAATALLFCITDFIHAPRAIFIVISIISWGSYIYFNARHGDNLRKWGLVPTWQETRGTLKWSGAVFAVALSSMLIWASHDAAVIIDTNTHQRRGYFITPNFIWLLMVYPFWGCVQQLLVLGIGARDILILVQASQWFATRPQKHAVITTTIVVGVLFGLVHALAEPSLLFACIAMGIVWVGVFFKYSCLYPLGAFHGLLGAVFYFMVLRRDPLLEL